VTARRALCFACFAVAATGGLARADERGAEKGVFGIGLIVGEPTGVSAKYYLVDAAVGAAFIGRGYQVHADYLWHPWVLDQKESFALPVYIGGGLRVLDHNASDDDEDHVRIGLRVPAGILFDFTRIPLDVFAELAGVLDYRTAGDASFGVDVNFGAGARYYF
jgi:hypothetical protein